MRCMTYGCHVTLEKLPCWNNPPYSWQPGSSSLYPISIPTNAAELCDCDRDNQQSIAHSDFIQVLQILFLYSQPTFLDDPHPPQTALEFEPCQPDEKLLRK